MSLTEVCQRPERAFFISKEYLEDQKYKKFCGVNALNGLFSFQQRLYRHYRDRE